LFKREKIYYLAIIWLSIFVLAATPVFATNSISIEFGEADVDNQTVPILYNSTGDISGFQFFIIGMDITNIFGGVAGENSFYLHQGATCWGRDNDCKDFVLGFSESVSFVPPGSGILFYLNYAEIGGDDPFDDNIIVSDLTCLDISAGFIIGPQGPFEVNMGECMDSPVDCNGDYYGSAYYDECGICSEGETEHVANSDKDCSGVCFGDAVYDSCGEACIEENSSDDCSAYCDADPLNDCRDITINLDSGANLISFYALSDIDNSIDAIFSELGDNALYMMTEGAGAFNQSGNWYGSLQQIEGDKGYWLIVEETTELIIYDAIPTSTGEGTVVYDLDYGNNLISYPFLTDQSIDDAIDENYLNSIFAIAGSGSAAQYVNGVWYGDLQYLDPSSGYWMVTYENVQFQFNQPDYDAPPRNSSDSRDDHVPELFTFTQSPYQAFYWTVFADIDGEPLVPGEDWIGAFYGDVCVGSREWSSVDSDGTLTDVPVMGYYELIEATHDYIVAGEYPQFKIYDASSYQECINSGGDTDECEASAIYDAVAYDNHVFEGALLAMYSIDELKVERDCHGELGGDAKLDYCGTCDNDPENDCSADCSNTEETCDGDWVYPYCWGGSAELDDCDICSGGATGHVANSDKDDCGDCFGGNADMDCNGNCGLHYYAAYIDDCGVCSGGYSGHLANSDQDCNGVCFGDAYEDDCNVCSGGDSGHVENTDKDCNGDCFGEAVIDDCGTCTGGTTELEFNGDKDCMGECFGPAFEQDYCFDSDSDGYGSTEQFDSEIFCNLDSPSGWVPNCADPDDSCTSNYYDCMDVCDGTDMVTTYYFDNDGDLLGGDTSNQYCSGDVPPNWETNSSDVDDNCYSNIHDCAGVCDGDAVVLIYWYDNDGDDLGAGISQAFCNAEVPLGWVENNNDEDDNCYSNIHDCAGECNGSAQIITYCEDADGDELGNPDTEAEYCNTECSGVVGFCVESVPNGWTESCDDEDDDCYSNIHDCAGVCDGESVLSGCDNVCGSTLENDECGVCGGDGIPDGQCDCEGNELDCAGECGGDAVFDNCFVCDNIPENDCPYDCLGIFEGDASVDECGVCEGDNTTCLDCAGIPNGDSNLDNCGVCDNDPENDCDYDCLGVLNGDAVFDNCGNCDNDPENNCTQDCGGEWGGNATFATFYFDQDGDGYGYGVAEDYCNTQVPPGWVGNNADVDDNCYSNYHDCTGVCNGSAFDDSCGVCSGGDSGHVADSDIDCNGDCFGEAFIDECDVCAGGNTANDISNYIDANDFSGAYDCGGDCFGEAFFETYYIDNDGDGLGTGEGEDYCNAVIPSGWVGTPYDQDDNCYSNIHDCAGVCDGDDEILTYYFDNDGDDLGAGTGVDYCSAYVESGWELNNDDIDDNCYSNAIDECGVCDGDDSSCTGCPSEEVDAFNEGCHFGEIPPDDEGCGNVITIDDGSCTYMPEEFSYHQSQSQAFYIVEEGYIQQEEIEDFEILRDWIAVFKDSVCVGSYPWIGNQTTIPAMGWDLFVLPETENYLLPGDYPTFFIYDSSEDEYMSTSVNITDLFGNEYDGWDPYEFFFIEEIVGNGPDCSGMELGTAYVDECGICICGHISDDESLLGCLQDIPNIDLDCNGVCEPSTPVGALQLAFEGLEYGAFVDNCGVCSEGSTGHVADSDYTECGCFNPAPEDYWLDVDNDGLGFGEVSFEMCLDNVTELYANNNDDPEPECPNPDMNTLMLDDCLDCVGSEVSFPNENMDPFGMCCEFIEKDSCGVCFGNDSYCNQPVAGDQNIETDEDIALVIELSASDPNGDPIVYSIIEEPENGILSGAGQPYLTYTPISNVNGIDSFIFTATDGNWTSSPGTITIDIQPVNDAPAMSEIGNQEIDEDGVFIYYSLDANDIDSEQLFFSANIDSTLGTVYIDGDTLTIIPIENYNGELEVLASVSDGELTDSAEFLLNVLPINDPPEVIGEIQDITVFENSEDIEILLSEVFYDIENGSELAYSVSENIEGLNTNVVDSVLILSFIEGIYGAGTVEITASDYISRTTVSISFNVEIISVDDPPYVDPMYIELDEDSEIEIILSAQDDGNSLSYSIVSDPSHGSLTLMEENVYLYSPDYNYYGIDSFIFDVNDGEHVIEAIVNIVVIAINDSPYFTIDNLPDAIENSQYDVNIEIEDPDNAHSELVLSIISSPDWLELDEYSLVGIPENNDAGTYDVTLELSDGIALVLKTFSLYIENDNSWVCEDDDLVTCWDNTCADSVENCPVEPGNYSPVLAQIDTIVFNEDESTTVPLSATDVDYVSFTYSANSTSNDINISLNDNLLTLTGTADYFGDGIITVTVTDNEGAEDSQDVIFYILPVNDPPQLGFLSDPKIPEDSFITYYLSSEDIDSDELTHSAVGSDHIAANINNNYLTITPDNNWSGSESIIVSVSDGDLIDSRELHITVLEVNDEPEFTSIDSLFINEDHSLDVFLNATDSDNEYLTYGVVDTAGMTVSLSTNVLTITPPLDYNGSVDIVVSVSDGEHFDYTDFTLTVNAVNDAPIVSQSLEDIEIIEDSGVATIELMDVFFDVDGDNFAYDVSNNVDGIIFTDIFTDATGSYLHIYTLTDQFGGPITVTVTADDQQGAIPITDQLDVTVIPVNDSPTIISTPDLLALEDVEYSYQILVEDVDNDVFYYNLMSSPEGMVVDSNGVVSWTPAEGIFTSGIVALAAWDVEYPISGNDIPDIQEFIIEVLPVNDPPEIVSTAPSSATEDELYSYQVITVDSDDDVFDYLLTNQPDGMTIDSTGLVTWTPVNGVLSSGTVTVSVSDGGEDGVLPSHQEYFIVVMPVNDPPVIVSSPYTSVMVTDTYYYQVVVTDVDDDEFTYVLSGAPLGMTIDETGYVTWVPESPGYYGPITILVYDGGDADSDGIVEIEPVSQEMFIYVTPFTDLITMCWDFNSVANLISFAGIPGDSTLYTVFEPLGDNINSVIGQSMAAVYIDGVWQGSLETIEPTDGYWITLEGVDPIDPPITYCIDAYPTDPSIIYTLMHGVNLVSYAGTDGLEIGEAIPDDIEEHITGIIGEGVAAKQVDGVWVGSLTNWELLSGYWIEIDVFPVEFNFVNDGLVRKHYSKTKVNQTHDLPKEFSYKQSTQQSFYFFDAVMVDGIDVHLGEWIIATVDDIVVGAREWNGEVLDVPVMGSDGRLETSTYCKNGDIPEFKLFRPSTDEIVNLTGQIVPWENNTTYFAGTLENVVEIPNRFNLGKPYPNPFNPTTSITYDVATDCEIEIAIFDIKGRLIEKLVSGVVQAGYYEIQWNAKSQASGIYFLRMVTPESAMTQKLIIMK